MHQPGTNIKTLRLQLGLKQKQLAVKAGVDQATVSNIERGALGYSQESLVKIAKALDVSLGVLFADGDAVDAAAVGARRVPVITAAEVAGWRGLEEATFDWDEQRFIFAELKTASRFAFALEVMDNLNSPLLLPADIAIFEMKTKPVPWDVVIATLDAVVIVGRLRLLSLPEDATPQYEVVPADGLHPGSSTLLLPNLKICGVLVEVRRTFATRKI